MTCHTRELAVPLGVRAKRQWTATGTPANDVSARHRHRIAAGLGALAPDDVVDTTIDGVGTPRNTVAAL